MAAGFTARGDSDGTFRLRLFEQAPRESAGTRIRRVIAVIAVVCAMPATASAAPGQVDPAFGHLANGTVLADHGQEDVVVKVLHQPDGKLVTITHGNTANGESSLVVSRYLANGSLDPSFGSGGIFSPSIPGIALVTDGVLQPDGKIVVVGSTAAPDFFVTRLPRERHVRPDIRTRTRVDGLRRRDLRRGIERRARPRRNDRGRRPLGQRPRTRALHVDRRARSDLLG